VIGRMGEYRTRTGYRITPVVGIVTPPFQLRADTNELDEIFEVPLAFLLDPANHQRHSREWRALSAGSSRFPTSATYIWGATAAMLVNLSWQLA
jgi:hypothetical protein